MKKNIKKWSFAGCMAIASMLEASESSFVEALKSGKPTVQLRLRYESVDKDTGADGGGLSLRTAVGYQTGTFNNFSGYVQLEDISVVGDDEAFYKGGVNSYVPDGAHTDVNMAYLSYKNNGFSFKAGRQTIIYDNARHVGNVGWRMNDQTFDAATLSYNSGALSLNYGYVWQVNNIFAAKIDTESHIVNASYKFKPGKLTGYYYGHDYHGNALASDTYGVRFAGATPVSSGKFIYELEGAMQDTAYKGGNNIDSENSYMHGALGYGFSNGVVVKAGYEELGKDKEGKGGSFSTPWSTAHAFNGWSDVTLGNAVHGNHGIKDAYLSVAGKLSGVKLMARYHDLSSGSDGKFEGSEAELLAVYKLKNGVVCGAKAAAFMSDADNSDVNKFWVWSELKF